MRYYVNNFRVTREQMLRIASVYFIDNPINRLKRWEDLASEYGEFSLTDLYTEWSDPEETFLTDRFSIKLIKN